MNSSHGPFVSRVCSLSFQSYEEFDIHMAKHETGKYVCEKCNEFETVINFEYHHETNFVFGLAK
jgi:hypothetical protein